MSRLLALALVVLIALPAAADDAQKEKTALKGTWKVTKATRGGQPPPDAGTLTLHITDEEITPQIGDKKESAAKYKLDPSKSPKHIDLMPGNQTLQGIYELKEDTLKLCFIRGNDGGRPTSFDAAGENVMYIEATREKK